MKFLKVTILVFIVVAFTSCKCLHHVQGIVIDTETRLPIDNVVVKESGMYFMHTNSCGNFEFTSMIGGLFRCSKISLSLEKEGYNKVRKKYKSCCTDNIVIILEKQAEGQNEEVLTN